MLLQLIEMKFARRNLSRQTTSKNINEKEWELDLLNVGNLLVCNKSFTKIFMQMKNCCQKQLFGKSEQFSKGKQ